MKAILFRRAFAALDRANKQVERETPPVPEPELPSTMVSQGRRKRMTFEHLRHFVNEAPIVPIQKEVLEAIQSKIYKKLQSSREQKLLMNLLFEEVIRHYEETMRKTNGWCLNYWVTELLYLTYTVKIARVKLPEAPACKQFCR